MEKKSIMDKSDDKSNNITPNDVFKMTDLLFSTPDTLYEHLKSSYNQFINENLKIFLETSEHTFFEKIVEDKLIRYKFEYSDISIIPPTLDNENEPMFPSDARSRSLTYSGKLVARVRQIQETINITTDEKSYKEIGKAEDNVPIALIPIMVRSQFCSLNLYKNVDKLECRYDPGGYFIVKGSEKVVISQDRPCENKPLVYIKKDVSGDIYLCQITSKSYKPNGITQIISIKPKNNILYINVPILQEINVIILLKALGIESDKDIINYIIGNDNDHDMFELLRNSLSNCTNDKGQLINTQEEAIDYLINKMRSNKKYSEVDKNVKIQQKKAHLKFLFTSSFVPHIDNDMFIKGIFVCYMINKLLKCILGRIPKDDRDSYVNKRIDLPGNLMEELFKQYYKKMLNDCNKFFKKRNQSDDHPVNIINQIKPTIIEQGLKNALATGSWIRRKGVAQMLQRISYMYSISSLRRIDAPEGDASTSKLTGPRHLHASSSRWMCCVQTPEHAKVGLTKHLSLIGSITIMQKSQVEIIKSFINKKIININDISSNNIWNYTKVFLNGDWTGVTDNAMSLYEELRQRKLDGSFDKTIGIVFDMYENEIKIYCEGGRGYAPAFIVSDNQIMLSKKHINSISLNKSDKTKISSWPEFMAKYPNIIEYNDMEEQSYKMIADKPETVYLMHKHMLSIKEKAKIKPKKELIINRYDDMLYNKYTHCEFHPSLLLGEISTTVPFVNCNAGPRNIFYYSQARQAMGIYTSNYRSRLDISYILFHPHRPLVTTKTRKYMHADTFPAGENIIVAILCYTGYNQEDSVIFNLSSVQRGLFRSSSLRKMISSVQKNQSTAQDDKFTKPDANKVTGMRHGSYDKLNEKGYVPEETKVVNGDIIIGKVSPIQPSGNSNKVFKDSSEVYKAHTPAVIDKVYTGIYNPEGYEMIKTRIRSMRTPTIGDKFCSFHGQKGTIGLLMKSTDMPFTKSGMVPDIILNPNAIPSRMTIGQLIECILGKVAAIEGTIADGTPFNDTNVEDIKDRLEKLGYDRNGTEYLYNGMTGQKMKSAIFIGPTFYNRLKHLVEDKLHSRARGPRTILTRQPPEGRAREGGLKLGEMERDSLLAHGIAKFLKEKYLDTSDPYPTFVCDKCGLFAQRLYRKESKKYVTSEDIFYCNACKNKTGVSKILIPYACKLLFQELMSLNIAPRIRCRQDIYNN